MYLICHDDQVREEWRPGGTTRMRISEESGATTNNGHLSPRAIASGMCQELPSPLLRPHRVLGTSPRRRRSRP